MKRRTYIETVAASTIPLATSRAEQKASRQTIATTEDDYWEWVPTRSMWRSTDSQEEIYLRGRKDEIVIYRPLVYATNALEGRKVVVRNQRKGKGLYKIEPWGAGADDPPAPWFQRDHVMKYVEENGQKKTIFYNFYGDKTVIGGWVNQ